MAAEDDAHPERFIRAIPRPPRRCAAVISVRLAGQALTSVCSCPTVLSGAVLSGEGGRDRAWHNVPEARRQPPLQEDPESNGGHAIEITCPLRPGKMPPVTGYLFGSRRTMAGGRAG